MAEFVLREGTTLKNGEFVVGRMLGKGGFGITYEVEQVNLEKRRVLKELFINGTCDRDDDGKTVFVLRSSREFFDKQKKRFRDEAKRIAKLSNPHIVQVHDVFEENGTVYYMMDFIEGKSLDDLLNRTGKPIGEEKVRAILNQMLDALGCIHGQDPPLCHLDIKPANIMMEGEKVVLIDFGASKYVANAGEERSSSTFFAYTPGYAPLEQLDGNRDEMGPWTDFYALGATLYCLLTGEKPASPSVIDDDHSPDKRVSIPMPDTVSQQMRQLVLWMMARSKKDRPKSVKEIRVFMEKDMTENTDDSGVSGSSGVSSHSGVSGHSDTSGRSGISGLSGISGRSGSSGGSGLSSVGGNTNVLNGGSKKPGKKGQFPKWMLAVVFALALVLVLVMGRTCAQKEKTSDASKTEKTSNGDTLTFNVKGVSFKMVSVQGGTFTMGATDEQGGDAWPSEKRVHEVTLSDYHIGETEVTQALWQAVMGENPSRYTGDTSRPVEEVSWEDCQKFIKELNSLTKRNFRLPTEAEWEFAARGGTKSRHYKYAGGNDIGTVAWYNINSSYEVKDGYKAVSKTHPVGQKTPNELGLYDMSGNVWEWCADWYGYYSSSAQTNPKGPSSASRRVIRGGSWDDVMQHCRVSYRDDYAPGNTSNSLGLRLAL